MQIGKGQVPLRLNFDPLSSAVSRSSASAKLSRSLAAASNPAAVRQQARQITSAAREPIQQKDRTEAYKAISSKLANVREALSVPATAKADTTTIKKVGETLNEAVNLLESLTAKGASRQDDALARDIQEGLQSLFNSSSDGSLRGLGDLGFSRDNGSLSLDADRLSQIETERPEELESFIGTFIGEKTAPLVNAATQALSDAESRGPLEQSLAQKAVAVQADISRLETRKQGLLQQQVRFEDQQASLKAQSENLKKTQRQLEREEETELPPDLLDVESRRAELRRDLTAGKPEADVAQALPAPAAPAAIGVGTQPVAPGVASFGLS